MGKSKTAMQPSKKARSKQSVPVTADEFQEAADREEETGGKWRIGDPAKSARAFVRAFEVYDQGLSRYPANFDLAYNKARLQLELSQQPPLVGQIGLPQLELLKRTLESHRYALKLKDDNPDILFNTSQVLISLAEQLSGTGDLDSAVLQLQEALELLSACLSRQDILLEEQRIEFEEAAEDLGGVQLEPEEEPAPTASSEPSEQIVRVEIPISPGDPLDTIHASLSALTTLVPLIDQQGLQNLGNMAESLTEKQAPNYIGMLPDEMQEDERLTIGLDRAIFVASFADAQYANFLIENGTYLERVNAAFEMPGKEDNAHALVREGEARVEFVLSTLHRFDRETGLPADMCWKQLTLAQDIYSRAVKLETDDAKERKASVYKLKGDLELLRHRLASIPDIALDAGVKRSTQTLVNNATAFYKGAAQLAKNDDDLELAVTSIQRWIIATEMATLLFGLERKPVPLDLPSSLTREAMTTAAAICIDEGLISAEVGERIVRQLGRN